eukprot:s469_g8.t1
MIWLKDKIELELAASRATHHSGFARTKDSFALRVKISLVDQVAKEVNKTSALVAGPRQPQKKHANQNQEEPFGMLGSDPWAGYQPTQQNLKTSATATQQSKPNGSQPAAPRQVEAPIAAKFTALENRLAMYETSLQELKSEQKHYTAAIETVSKQSETTAARVGEIEKTVKVMNGSMQQAIEGAIERGMASQEQKLDAKFQSLIEMLSHGSGSRKPSGSAKRIGHDEDGDADMDSPLKPPPKTQK